MKYIHLTKNELQESCEFIYVISIKINNAFKFYEGIKYSCL